ncbi:hypothetical protein EIP86_008300 [Pleurotus ostreatoroseus]|nr:hypothetical protein EIP86_008300 [Pleurotus ostreatoroseus]
MEAQGAGFYCYDEVPRIPETLQNNDAKSEEVVRYVKELSIAYFGLALEGQPQGESGAQLVEVDEEIWDYVMGEPPVQGQPVFQPETKLEVFVVTSLKQLKKLGIMHSGPDSKFVRGCSNSKDLESSELVKASERRVSASETLTGFPSLRVKMPRGPDEDELLLELRSWFGGFRLYKPPVGSSAISELTVQHWVGSPLAEIFELPSCQVWSDRYLPQYQEYMMAPNKNPPKADFAMFPSWMEGGDHKRHFPIFFVGESKQVKSATKGDASKDYRAQLQAAVYPMLVLLLLIFHINKDKNKTVSLPGEYVVYGIYFDQQKIEIYAHFPYWKFNGKDYTKGLSDKDTKATVDSYKGWRFAQVKVRTYNLPDNMDPSDKLSGEEQLDLIIALLAVRAQALRLMKLFQNDDNYKNPLAEIQSWEGTVRDTRPSASTASRKGMTVAKSQGSSRPASPSPLGAGASGNRRSRR